MSTPFTVVSNIPIPEKRFHTSYPFAQMNVGDSFDIGNKNPKSVRDAASRFRRKANSDAKFIISKADSVMVKGLRCWRVA